MHTEPILNGFICITVADKSMRSNKDEVGKVPGVERIDPLSSSSEILAVLFENLSKVFCSGSLKLGAGCLGE